VTSANHQHLSQSLDALTECTQAFSQLLDRESGALATRESDTIESLAREKRELGEQIEQLSQGLIQATHSEDHDLSSSLPSSLRPKWADLRSQLQEIQEKNQLNGQRVLLQSRQVDAAMSILRGAHDSDSSEVYGADGQRKGHDGSHRHVKV